MMIKVVHVVYRFDTGGLENGMVNLINRLAEAEYQHHIVTMKGHCPDFARRITSDNVTYHSLEKRRGNDVGTFFRLNNLLKQLQPDVLHTRNTASLEMQLVGWWRRVPLRIHGEHGWDVNDMHGCNPRYQKLRRFMSKFVHRYVTLSKEAYSYLTDTIGIDGKRIHHICNGVDQNKFSMHCRSYNGETVFGSVGRLAEVKNHVYLVRAFVALLQRSSVTARLHLIGDGDCKSKIEQLLAEHEAEQKVWLAGDRADVPEQMARLNAFILPSLAEGISNTILEAMASGLPVIATDVGGNPELVVEGVTGFLIPVNDDEALTKKMEWIAHNPKEAAKMGQAGRARVEQKFSIDAMTKAYDALYRSNQQSFRM